MWFCEVFCGGAEKGHARGWAGHFVFELRCVECTFRSEGGVERDVGGQWSREQVRFSGGSRW
jgi:hypothetical protein